MTMHPLKLAGIALATFLAFVLFEMTYFTVNQNERAVVTRWGEIVYVAEPGLHFRVPFVNSTQHYATDIQSVAPSKGVNTYTVDNQEVDVTFNVFYRLPADKVEYVAINVSDYRDRLYSMTIDRLKVEIGKVNVQSLAEKRGELRDAIKEILAKDARSLGVEVTDFQLTDLQYTTSFRQAVEQAAAQKAGIETREYERQQSQKVAETVAINAEGAANAVRAKAKGDADSRLFIAAADAKSIQLKGEAEATAILAQTNALKGNSGLVDLRRAERWDGKLPTQMFGSAPIPFFQVGGAPPTQQ